MNFLEKLQKKSHKEKMRIIWLTVICFGGLLFFTWIFTSRISQFKNRDTSLFQIMGRGLKDVGENFNKPSLK